LPSHHRTDAQRLQTCLASMQALRSQRTSATSKIPNCVIAHRQTGAPHRSDRSDPPARPVRFCCISIFVSSVLALWIKQGIQWFSGEPCWRSISVNQGHLLCHCRMDIPGPTTQVGTRTDYPVDPWDYTTCATRHLLAKETRSTSS
jgi:hypothetical protein